MLRSFQENKVFKKFDTLRVLLVGLFFILISTVILEIEFLPNELAELEVNDVAPRDIIAPASVSYESPIATKQEQERVVRLVGDVYGQPERNVGREQRLLASQIFDYLDAVRVDRFLTAEQKIDYIQAVESISLTAEEAAAVLNLSEPLWTDAKQEVDQLITAVMSEEIRETDLANKRFRLVLRVSSDVPEQEANVIISIAEHLIQPNSFPDQALTSAERQKARDAVQPVLVSFEENEIVIRAGERIGELTIEALEEMGFRQRTAPWRDFISTFLWLTVLVGGLGFYLIKYQPALLKDNQRLGLLVIICLIFITAIRAMVPGNDVLRYALPMAALTIAIAGTLDPRLAMVVTMLMGLVVGYVAGGSFELAVYVILTGLVVALQIERMAPVHTLLWAGLYAAVSNVVIILIFRLVDTDRILLTTNYFLTLFSQIGSGLLSGLVSAGLALVIFFVVGNLTNITTHIQLIELSRPTHPLLSELLRRAPGTYHHSLVVGNLAEQAAIRIGANPLLCRVGAYYHDVGKMVRPYFFTENTPVGVSLHDNLDPETSAQIIISHVTEGLRLAKKHRLPHVLHDFIAEHHGKEIVRYFYFQALQAADGDESEVDKAQFRYPGPKPGSKETAILMLADASESTVRSVQPQSNDEVNSIVRKTIANRMESGQFDECDLTMQDFEQIRIAFNDVLQGVSHHRVKYPDEVKEAVKANTGALPPLPLAMQSTPVPVSDDAAPPAVKPQVPIPRD